MSAVERVAKSLCTLDGHNPDDVGGESFDNGLIHWVAYEPQARAAIETMSEVQGAEHMKVLVYVDTNKEVGDRDHLKIFANEDAADAWFKENDPEGVAFEYPVEV